MPITTDHKKQVIEKHQLHPTDTGSSDVQVAVMSEHIAHLTEHLRSHPKDHNSRRGLLKLVAKRRKLLDYLRLTAEARYRKLIDVLKLRK